MLFAPEKEKGFAVKNVKGLEISIWWGLGFRLCVEEMKTGSGKDEKRAWRILKNCICKVNEGRKAERQEGRRTCNKIGISCESYGMEKHTTRYKIQL